MPGPARVSRQIAASALTLFLFVCNPVPGQTAGVPEDIRLDAVGGGEPFVLSEHRGEYVALHFLLKTECPYCIRHTWEYSENASSLPGVVQVFIKPDSEEEISAWMENLPEDGKLSFPIYRDPGAGLAEKLGIPGGYPFHGQVVHYPALVLLGPGGKEVFRYVGESNRDRYSFDQLKAKLEELTKD